MISITTEQLNELHKALIASGIQCVLVKETFTAGPLAGLMAVGSTILAVAPRVDTIAQPETKSPSAFPGERVDSLAHIKGRGLFSILITSGAETGGWMTVLVDYVAGEEVIIRAANSLGRQLEFSNNIMSKAAYRTARAGEKWSSWVNYDSVAEVLGVQA